MKLGSLCLEFMLTRRAEKTSEWAGGLVATINNEAVRASCTEGQGQRTGLALGSELACAGFAGADFAKMVEAVDAGCMAVGKFNLDGVGADGSGGARRDFWLEHG